jgi:hypothetical protein
MGLDMFLKGKRYLYPSSSNDTAHDIQRLFPELEHIPSHWGEGTSIVTEVVVDLGYWRKANAIHGWFVREVQREVDDCGYYEVPAAKLEMLREQCEAVLTDNSLAPTLLPVTEGFFFGGREYDDWYFRYLKDTIAIIDAVLPIRDKWTFYYHSSW